MTPSSELFRLIKSMTKSEKRFFKMVSYFQDGEKNYLNLFDCIEEQAEYDEEAIKTQFSGTSFIKHLPSEKNHLYKLILKSLRLFYSEGDVTTLLSEQIQNIEILYSKGLLGECSKLIKRTKKIATLNERFYFQIELIRWEKTIIDEISESANFNEELNELINEEQIAIEKLKNLASLQLHYSKVNFLFKKYGYVRSKAEPEIIRAIQDCSIVKGEINVLSQRGEATLAYVRGLCAILENQIDESFDHFNRLINLFEENPNLINNLPVKYLNSLGKFLYFYIQKSEYDRLFEVLKNLRKLDSEKLFNRFHLKTKLSLLSYYYEILAYERIGDYTKCVQLMEKAKLEINIVDDRIPKSELIPINYLFSKVMFGSEKYREALRYLNNILNYDKAEMRQDILSFSKILNLLIHFELGNFDLLDYLTKSTERFFEKKKHSAEISFNAEFIFLKHFKSLIKNSSKQNSQEVLKRMRHELKLICGNQNEQSVLEYFDYLNWIEAHINGQPYGNMRKILHNMPLQNPT